MDLDLRTDAEAVEPRPVEEIPALENVPADTSPISGCLQNQHIPCGSQMQYTKSRRTTNNEPELCEDNTQIKTTSHTDLCENINKSAFDGTELHADLKRCTSLQSHSSRESETDIKGRPTNKLDDGSGYYNSHPLNAFTNRTTEPIHDNNRSEPSVSVSDTTKEKSVSHRVDNDYTKVLYQRVNTPGYEHETLEIAPDPPIEIGLNSLLAEISPHIDEDDLQRIKLLFVGPKGIGKRLLEKFDTPSMFFTTLREMNYISRGNIVYLNKILYMLNKPDLIQKAAAYCRQEGNVVHYYQTETELEPGENAVQFHIVANITNCDAETIERLRNNVAKIVCAPLETVRITSVQPDGSVLVTLIMPTIYTEVLKKLLLSNANLWELRELQVDAIIIDARRFDIGTGTDSENFDTFQQRTLKDIYKQNVELQRLLEVKRLHVFTLEKEVAMLKKTLAKTEKAKELLSEMNVPACDVVLRPKCNGRLSIKSAAADKRTGDSLSENGINDKESMYWHASDTDSKNTGLLGPLQLKKDMLVYFHGGE